MWEGCDDENSPCSNDEDVLLSLLDMIDTQKAPPAHTGPLTLLTQLCLCIPSIEYSKTPQLCWAARS